MLKKHGQFLATLFIFSDMFVLFLCWVAAFYARFGSLPFNDAKSGYGLLFIVMLILYPFILKNMGLYRPRRIISLFAEVFDVFKTSTLALVVLISVSYFLRKSELSRLFLIYFWLFSIVVLSLERMFLREILRSLRRRGYNVRKVLIVGADDLGIRVARKIIENPWTGFEVVGFLSDRRNREDEVEGLKVLGKTNEVADVVSQFGVDQVFIALPVSSYKKMLNVVNSLRAGLVTIRVVPDIYQELTLNASFDDFEGMPLVNLSDTPMYGWNIILKRGFDILFSLAAIILTAPLMLIISFIIKLKSRGPVFFTQQRYGLDGKEIKIYKFRTMSVCEDGKVVSQVTENDSRVTKLGAFLRKCSIDELPQFVNVLQGRMSVVGPRPHAVAHNEQYRKIVKRYMLRHKVKPGITGWAQVNGWRGETNTVDKMEKRVEYDLYYIEHWSIWLDVKIMLLTVWKGMVNKHAY